LTNAAGRWRRCLSSCSRSARPGSPRMSTRTPALSVPRRRPGRTAAHCHALVATDGVGNPWRRRRRRDSIRRRSSRCTRSPRQARRHELSAERCRVGARDLARRPVGARDRARREDPARRGRVEQLRESPRGRGLRQDARAVRVVERRRLLLLVRDRECDAGVGRGYAHVGCGGKRGTPDVSLDADPASGVSVYDSVRYQGQSGWFTVGGTSASSPMWRVVRPTRPRSWTRRRSTAARSRTATSPSATTARRAWSTSTCAPGAAAGSAERLRRRSRSRGSSAAPLGCGE